MFPSEVLVTPTVAGVPAPVLGGCTDAVGEPDAVEEPPLLPQAASVSPASATIAPLARKVRADLRGIMIRSFGWGEVGRSCHLSRSADRRGAASVNPASAP